jgi:hypothetical protein
MSKTIVLELEDADYERLLQEAKAAGQQLEELAAQRLRQQGFSFNGSEGAEALDANGWPVGFFEETFGSLAADPLQRLPQDSPETREEIK